MKHNITGLLLLLMSTVGGVSALRFGGEKRKSAF